MQGWNPTGRKVYVVGVGMTKFEKPGGRDWDYPDMGQIALTRCLEDAGIDYKLVEQACVGYVYGDSTCGQRALYTVGLTGIPVYNVNNNCATGSTALYMARQFVQGGLSDCVVALGFEKMEKGSLGSKFMDRTNPMDKHVGVMMDTFGFAKGPPAAQLFGNAGKEHMNKHGTLARHMAMIAEKNHRHSANNPYSQFRDVYTLEQISNSPKVHDPLTKLQCCPTSDGAACALLCSEEFVLRHGLQSHAVEIIGQSMKTDFPSSFEEKSMIKCVGYDMTAMAARDAFTQAQLTPDDVQVVELHDCFSANELLTYEALGLCGEGQAGAFIDAGDNTYGGKYVVNPSGGLISKGHPLGATGLAQCAELVWQLRGQANQRQVDGVQVGLQHNLGLGGAAVVTLYRRASWEPTQLVAPHQTPRPLHPAYVPPDTKKATGSGVFKAESIFKALANKVDASMVQKVGVIYRFELSSGKSTRSWVVDLKNGEGGVSESKEGGDCVVIMKDGDFAKLMTGKLNPQQAFMGGKLKIKGNMMLAMKLSVLMEPKPSL